MSSPLPSRRTASLALSAALSACCMLCLLSPAPCAAEPAGAAERSEDPLLRSAPERIRKHRTGPVTITVTDAAGKPVAGARVTVTQKRHEFLFGCNIFQWGRVGSPQDEAAYRSRFQQLFNFATLPFYWKRYEPSKGQPEHAGAEAVGRWCRAHGITPKGHPLVWNHPAGVPRWLPADAVKIHTLSDARVSDCVSRFKGLIDTWDVVNEATDPLRFKAGNRLTAAYEQVGVLDWTIGSFLAARKANPSATLLINDYRTAAGYEKLITHLVHDGKPVYDVIGIQSHMHGGVWPPRKIWDVCERFAKFHVPLHFTETTIVSGRRTGRGWGPTEPELERKQARDAAMLYTMLFSHPAVEAITWWDFSDRRAWQGAAAGFLRRDLSPKPVYERLKKLIRDEWWTRESATTDARGKATLGAFFGEHEVRVQSGSREEVAPLRHRRRDGRSSLQVTLSRLASASASRPGKGALAALVETRGPGSPDSGLRRPSR